MNQILKTLTLTALCTLFLSHNTWGAEITKLRLLYDGKMHDYNQKEIHLTLDNKALTALDMPPVSLDGRTYVPLRAIADAMGADVAWQRELGEIYITKGNNIVVFKINDIKASKNGQIFTMDVPAKVINERTLVPLRGFAEALDCQIKWDDATRTVAVITTKTETSLPEIAPPVSVSENKDIISKAAESVVAEIKTSSLDGVDVIVLHGNVSVNPIVSRLTEPDRLVIDLPDTSFTLTQNPSTQGLSVVTAIRTGLQEDKTFRIVLELTPKAGCTITRDGGNLLLMITNSGDNIILPTVSPPTASPPTVGLPTVSPPTVSPPTASPPTASPPTVGLPTVSPPTVGLPTVGLPTVSPPTASLPTASLPTASPPTASPPTASLGSLKNISYDSIGQILKLKKIKTMETASIKHMDYYRNATYQLTLPGDYSAEYGTGRMSINDEILTNVDFAMENGLSTVTFHENRIRSYWISEDSNYYYINVKDPKAVYPKIVVLDAGHGGNDPGTTGNGIQEKNVALIIAQKVCQKLENDNGIKVYFIRSDDTNPEKAWRADFANDVGDIFVSVHLNTADTDTAKKPLPNGTEALYAENATQIGSPLNNKTLATLIQKNVVLHLGSNDRGLKLRDDLLILNRTKIPTAIIEVAFLSNPGEALKITQEQNQNLAANGICAGILEALAIIK